jgi:hypothetical protein
MSYEIQLDWFVPGWIQRGTRLADQLITSQPALPDPPTRKLAAE